jgi:hypothetical protein
MSERDLKCSCEVCSIPDSILNLPAKLKACPFQRHNAVCENLFSQIPLADAKIIQEDFEWVSSKIASICRFADGVDGNLRAPISENLMKSSRKIASSLLPFATDISLDASMLFLTNFKQTGSFCYYGLSMNLLLLECTASVISARHSRRSRVKS